MRRIRAFLVFIAAIALGLVCLSAQGRQPQWIEDSPPGGEVFQLALDGGNPDRIYAAAGYLYVSRNRGTSWELLELPQRGIGAVLAAPSQPGLFYALDRPTLLRGEAGGAKLEPVESTRSFSSSRLRAVDPANPDRLYISDTVDVQMLRSDDGGRTWQDISPFNDFDLTGLALHPDEPGLLLACDPSSLWRSEDGGSTWRLVLFPSSVRFGALSFVSEHGAVAAGDQLWVSSDRGQTWQRSQPDPETPISDLAASISGPTRVYASTGFRVLRSDDGGRKFQETNRGLEHREITDLLVDPRDSSVVHAATRSGGVFITRDAGEHWHLNSEGMRALTNQAIELQSGALLAATEGGLFARRPGEVRWRRRGGTNGAAPVLEFAPTPLGTYASSSSGLLFSADDGQSWQRLEHPDLQAGCLDIAARLGSDGDPAEAFAVVYCAMNTPGRDLLRIEHRQGEVSTRQIEQGFQGLQDIAIDPFRRRTVYVTESVSAFFGARFGSLAVSSDDGATWTRTDPDGDGLLGLALSPQHEGRLLTFQRNTVYISNDRGETFGPSSIPGQRAVESVVIDPRDRRTYYVASDVELFVSRDSGGSLRRLPNLPRPGLFRGLTIGRAQPLSLLAAARGGVFRLPLETDVIRLPLAFGGARTDRVSNGHLMLYNTSADAPITADVIFINEEGREARQRINVPARGLRTAITVSGFASGWAEVLTSGGDTKGETPLRLLNFLTAGNAVAAADSGSLSRTFFLPLLEGWLEDASTLLALANPAQEPRSVHLQLRNPDSGRRAEADVEIPARGQLLLRPSDIEWRYSPGLETDFSSFVGYIEGHATPSPVLVTGLLQVGQDLAALTPARSASPRSPRTGPAADNQLLFPQFGHGEDNGALLGARLVLFNSLPVDASAQVDFIASDGTPLATALNDDSPQGRSEVTVAANSVRLLEAPLPPPGRLDLGWMRVTSSRPLQGWLILSGNLGTATLSGRPPAESVPDTANSETFLPVVNSVAPFRSTGLAVANPSQEDVRATLLLYNSDGLRIATAPFDLPANSQRGAFLPEIDFRPEPNTALPPLNDFEGLLVVSSPAPLSTSLIHLRPGRFALLPLP